MRVEQLKCLIHIADSGSISRSAEALSISQQGLSQSMRQLERELGVQLLYREGNRTKLTAAGKQLRPEFETILRSRSAISDIISSTSLMNRSERMSCRLHVTPNFCISVMPAVLQRASRLYPNLHLSVMEDNILSILHSGDFDVNELFVLTLPARFLPDVLAKPGLLEFKEFYRKEIHALLAEGHPLADREVITVDDLCQYPVAVLGSDIYLLKGISGDRFQDLNIFLHTSNFELYRSASAMKNVISLTIPLGLGRHSASGLQRIPLERTETILHGYVINKYAQRTVIGRELLNIIESQVVKGH